jgi:hypothetical protein
LVELFDGELPSAMNALLDDQSPAAIARASVTYDMIVEGVLAETGYANYHRSLAVNELMPGLCAGLVNIKRAGGHRGPRDRDLMLERPLPGGASGHDCARASRSGAVAVTMD